jgi:phosphoribosyl 1,2-cyclic phosphodiesterase
VDAGISRRQVLERMRESKLDASKVRAIFISHEHSDHLKGVRVLSKHLNAPVFMTLSTFEKSRGANRPAKILNFDPGDVVDVGEFKVHTFLKQHDAVQPCSFRIEYGGLNVGVLTDIGEPCDNVIEHFSACEAVFLESNYDEDMLWNGPYPWHLKNRVASAYGHLSNRQAFELLESYGGVSLEAVFLSHISADNNRPEIALRTFESLKSKYNVMLTNRYAAADVFKLVKKKVAKEI